MVRQMRLHGQSELGRFVRFGMVGLSGTALDFAILTLLKVGFGVPTLPANVVSYTCGAVSNFFLNRAWTYGDAPKGRTLLQLGQFITIGLIGLVLNNLVVAATEYPAGLLLHNAAYGYIPAKLVATLIVLMWNFWANRFWTFKAATVTA